jgi:cob(I)alamin adenosyltransferase
VAAYGDVDELNAGLGAVRARAPGTDLARLLLGVQKDLFAIGAQLADPDHRVASKRAKAAISATRVRRLERAIDVRDARLPPLRTFVLPGGTAAAASLHLARAVCRRAERSVVALSHRAEVDPRVVVYLNRLSDLLFVLARYENFRAGQDEEPW